MLQAPRKRWAFVELCFADGGDAGDLFATSTRIRVEIVGKPKGPVGGAVRARRWVVEHVFASIDRTRRSARDCEASITSAEALPSATSVVLRRCTRRA